MSSLRFFNNRWCRGDEKECYSTGASSPMAFWQNKTSISHTLESKGRPNICWNGKSSLILPSALFDKGDVGSKYAPQLMSLWRAHVSTHGRCAGFGLLSKARTVSEKTRWETGTDEPSWQFTFRFGFAFIGASVTEEAENCIDCCLAIVAPKCRHLLWQRELPIDREL